jgi:hypothetical protein
MEIYFVFFLPPPHKKEERNPTHIAHIGKPHEPKLKPKLTKEYNFAYALSNRIN